MPLLNSVVFHICKLTNHRSYIGETLQTYLPVFLCFCSIGGEITDRCHPNLKSHNPNPQKHHFPFFEFYPGQDKTTSATNKYYI